MIVVSAQDDGFGRERSQALQVPDHVLDIDGRARDLFVQMGGPTVQRDASRAQISIDLAFQVCQSQAAKHLIQDFTANVGDGQRSKT